MPRTCAGTNRNQLNKTKKREAVEREVRALESAVRAELWPLVFFRISPMAQHEGQRAMAMIHADRFRWEQDVLANPQLTAAQKIVLTRLALHLNIKTGRCDPSVKTLATGVGMAERTGRLHLELSAQAG